MTLPDWWERELRTGGILGDYIEREKATMKRRMAATARIAYEAGHKPNPKSDWKLIAEIPGRLFARLTKMDPHFFQDDKNLRNLRRDNEELRPLIHV